MEDPLGETSNLKFSNCVSDTLERLYFSVWANPHEVKKKMKYKEQLCASETFVCLYELLKSQVVCRYSFCGISRWSFVSFLYISPRGEIQYSSRVFLLVVVKAI